MVQMNSSAHQQQASLAPPPPLWHWLTLQPLSALLTLQPLSALPPSAPQLPLHHCWRGRQRWQEGRRCLEAAATAGGASRWLAGRHSPPLQERLGLGEEA